MRQHRLPDARHDARYGMAEPLNGLRRDRPRVLVAGIERTNDLVLGVFWKSGSHPIAGRIRLQRDRRAELEEVLSLESAVRVTKRHQRQKHA